MTVAHTVDDIITLVTDARDDVHAYDILNTYSIKTLDRVADQLYVEVEGRRRSSIIQDIIKEARA